MKNTLKILVFVLIVLVASMHGQDTALVNGRLSKEVSIEIDTKVIVFSPFSADVTANSLIIRLQGLNGGKNYITPINCTLTDGDYSIAHIIEPIDWNFNQPETDFELPLGEIRKLSAETILKLEFAESEKPELSVYAVLPVIFRKNDLSNGLDFETPETTGTWLVHEKGELFLNHVRARSGKTCLHADFPTINTMISVLPGERDWSKYAVLRFTIENPLPTAQGRRSRVCFLFDGKTVEQPSPLDTLSSGIISLLEESTNTFELDLRRFAKLHPKFNLKNVKSFQIFWSNVVCGSTVFYMDDFRLLTEDELIQEENAKYLNKIDALKKIPQSPELENVIAELDRRFQAGERESLNKTLLFAAELGTIATMRAKNKADEKILLLNAPPAIKIMRDTIPQATDDPIRISAAGNERESFQIVAVPFVHLKNVIITSSSLVSEDNETIPASAVTINPIGYVEVLHNAFPFKENRPGMWPDVLMDNRPNDLPPRIQSFMITVAVPDGQKAGIYKGELSFDATGLDTRKIPFECRVYGFSLPVRGKLKTWFSLSHLPENKELRYKIYDMFFDYRLNPTSMYSAINDTSVDKVVPTEFAPLPEDIPYCMSKGLNFMSIGYMINHAAPDYFKLDDAFVNVLLDHIRKSMPVLKETGAIKYAFINGFDEIMHKPDTRDARLKDAYRVCEAVKKNFPELPIANIGLRMKIDRSLMDIWFIPPAPRKDFADLQEQGATVGFYWAYQEPSFMLDQHGIAPRICAWLTWKEGAEGMGYYSVFRPANYTNPRFLNMDNIISKRTRTVENCVPPNMPRGLDWNFDVYRCEDSKYEGRNGDGTLLYPTDEGYLLPSLRLTNLRDGIEDYEYFALLKELADNNDELLKVSDDIITVHEGDYTTDISKLMRQRNAIAEAIEKLSMP